MRRQLGLPAEDGDDRTDSNRRIQGPRPAGIFAARKERKRALAKQKKSRRAARKAKRRKK